VTARAGAAGDGSARTDVVLGPILDIAAFWTEAGIRLDRAASFRTDAKSAIYGAGFYGSFIAARIGKIANLVCFIDRNPHLHGKSHFGYPVVSPERLPNDVGVVYAGVNPLKARAILTNVPEWNGRKIEKIFMDEPRL
jgi:hypothetical protein